MKVLIPLTILLCAACVPHKNTNRYLDMMRVGSPSVNAFYHCFDYDCASSQLIQLSGAQWQQVEDVFYPRASNAEQERQQVRQAIAQLESIVGGIAGTSADLGGFFNGISNRRQHDCVDESTNTTVYLTLFRQQGWLQYHEVLAPIARLTGAWPHQTAVMQDKLTGKNYAVDSWFLDNGQPAFVLPLEQWRAGWQPQK